MAHNLPENIGDQEQEKRKIQDALQALDLQYYNTLLPQEQSLQRLLEQISSEEEILRRALDEARGVGPVQQRQRSKRDEEAAAAARLEDALLLTIAGDGSSDDDETTAVSKRARTDASAQSLFDNSTPQKQQAATARATGQEEASVMSKSSAMARLEQALLASDGEDTSSDDN